MVVIVKTPLQLICAMEYIHQENIPLKDILFIYLEKYQFSNIQIINTFDFYKITNYTQLRFRNSNIANIFGKKVILGKNRFLKIPFKLFALWFNFFVEKRLYKIINNHHSIIFGDPNYKLYRKLSKQLFDKKIILLDDGLSSEKIDTKYSEQNIVNSFSFLRNPNIKQQNDQNTNTFSFLKSLTKPIDSNFILFIGQPLVEARLITQETLEKWFKKIGTKYKNHTILYYPHRWELEYTSYQFPDNFETISETQLPIEISVATYKTAPALILSFYSSALVTLKSILPNDVEFYAIDISKSINNTKVDHAYEIINGYDIEILNF